MDKINEVKNKLDDRAGNPHLGMERQIALDALNVITEQESEIARLRTDLVKEKSTAAMLRIDLSAANIAAEKLRKDLLTAKNAVDSAEMSAKCSRALKEKAESENLELLEKCRRLEFANEQLRYKLNAHRDGIVKLSAERDEKNKAVETFRKESEQLRKDVFVLREERDELKGIVEDITEEKKGLFKKLQSTEEQLNKMTEKAAMAAYAMTEANTLARKDGSRIFTHLNHCPSCGQCIQISCVVPEREKQTVNVLFRDGKRKYGLCPACERSVDSEENATACGRCGKLLEWGEDNAD